MKTALASQAALHRMRSSTRCFAALGTPKRVVEIVCEWHFHPDEMAKPNFQAADAVEFWDLTNKEDWGISELSQAGIKSRAYKPGPYSPREGLPHAFDRMVLEREREAKERGEPSRDM